MLADSLESGGGVLIRAIVIQFDGKRTCRGFFIQAWLAFFVALHIIFERLVSLEIVYIV